MPIKKMSYVKRCQRNSRNNEREEGEDSTSLLGLRAKKSDHTTKTPSQRTQTSKRVQHKERVPASIIAVTYLPPRPTKGIVRIAVGAEVAVNICGDSTQEVTDGTDLHGCISS